MMCDNDFRTVSIIMMFVSHNTIVITIVNLDDKKQNYVAAQVMSYKNTAKCNLVIIY